MPDTSLYPRIYALVGRIPYGRVATYGQIARALGMPHGARVVGWAMRECPAGLPWHRVVNAQGAVSTRGHPEGTSLQQALLEEEGAAFDAAGRLDLRVFGWDEI
jgi:methylated-DNA-protein-cysteine methyltransferase-like protein